MKDGHGRQINYMRISLTENCNLRCTYCMPEDCKIDEKGIMSTDEVITIIRTAANIGIDKIRFTGGEPLLHKQILKIIEETRKIDSIREICMTSNGILLEKMAEKLKAAGLDRVNISLDTLDPVKYREMTRGGDLQKVLRAIDRCDELGIKVSINSVIIKGINEDSVKDLVEMTLDKKIKVRFIELMPIGVAKDLIGISGKEILTSLKEKYNLLREDGSFSGTAKYWKLSGAEGKIGFINPVSSCFCSECNRIRITAQGEVKRCLNSPGEINIKKYMRDGMSSQTIEAMLRAEIYRKPREHFFQGEEDRGELKCMNQIGG